jgi:hypothetical protein
MNDGNSGNAASVAGAKEKCFRSYPRWSHACVGFSCSTSPSTHKSFVAVMIAAVKARQARQRIDPTDPDDIPIGWSTRLVDEQFEDEYNQYDSPFFDEEAS